MLWSLTPVRRPPSHWRRIVRRILAIERELGTASDEELLKRSLALRYRARSGFPLRRLLPEAYALVREAAGRKLGMRHFEVQLLGGIALFSGAVAEMETGEGKTFTATLPLYLYALAGRGAHLATANDYLARRDADWMRPVYETLGLTVGVVQSQIPRRERQAAYACDITYGTAKEFGFDFLRDRLLLRRMQDGQASLLAAILGQEGTADPRSRLQRDLYFALVDEADSILIDEARTPLILSATPTADAEVAAACYRWAASIADRFQEPEHYEYDQARRSVELTAVGRSLARSLPKPVEMAAVPQLTIYEFVERAVKVDRDFRRDRQYVVRDGEVVIVDEFTGRLSEGRKWRDGIHQAIEAREQLDISVESGHAAQITVQELFQHYERLAGMTGTAVPSARELKKVYRLPVVPIPTNRRCQRLHLANRVLGTADAKWAAVAQEIEEVHRTGRPVLVGTRSIEASDQLSRLLTERGIEHRVLHAKHLAAEAEIVAEAGKLGRVTVATNMAGRGTDIQLGEGVAELGGLYVIGTEMHEAARVDRQLAGRCARQGDPGSFRQFVALDDELLRHGLGPERAQQLAGLGTSGDGQSFDHLRALFRTAQRKIERKHLRDRKVLMHYVKQRTKLQTRLGQDPYLDTPGM
ncbi:MAG: preprotein translocase subunit SecA [Planctomycetes bacterium]|nr:preprotein translocase subunit SecA [Planctomycetota bacterium]